jgi:glycosyltransferase involved in cell wall biosynthesis
MKGIQVDEHALPTFSQVKVGATGCRVRKTCPVRTRSTLSAAEPKPTVRRASPKKCETEDEDVPLWEALIQLGRHGMHAHVRPAVDVSDLTPSAETVSELHIAIVGSRGYPSTYGGFETFVRHLAPWLAARGHAVTVYCRGAARGSGRVSLKDDIRCIHTPGIDSKTFSTLSFGATSIADAAFRRYDAVLVLNVANGFFLPFVRATGRPVAVNVDGIEWERAKWGWAARSIFLAGARMSARWADRLVVDSAALGDVWSDRFGADTTFIPYGAPVVEDPRPELVQALGIAPERYVLAVGRLTPENNLDLLLDALESLRSGPVGVVVGTANYECRLQRRVEYLDATGTIRWLRHVHDQELLTALWANAGLYVHGHSVGGTNPSLLQALGAGAPSLALDTPYNREVLQRDEQLFPSSVAALAPRIEDVLGSPAIRKRFRAHGQHIVATRYQWEPVCERYLAMFDEMAHAAPAARRPAPGLGLARSRG